MSVHIKDMKNLKMYNKNNRLFIPLNPDDNKHESLIYLLTSDISSSIRMINSDMIINNRKWFKSYYIDKSINAIIKADTNQIEEFVEYKDDFISSFINESKLSTKDRKELSDSEFGIPQTRSYPINDEEHVRAAIRMFNHCPKEYEKTLAKNIIKKLKHFNITDIEVGEENRFSKYYRSLKEVTVKTSGGIPLKILTDYRFEYYTGKDIDKYIKECQKLIKDIRDYKNVCEMLTNVNFLALCYDINDNLAGFGVSHKNPIYGNEFGIYLEDSYFDDDDEKKEISMYLIYTFRDVMYNRDINKQIASKGNRIVPVYSLNRDKLLIQNIKTSIVQDGNFIDRAAALKFMGKTNKNKDKYPVVYIDLIKVNIEKEKSPQIPESEINSEGFRYGNSAVFFGDEIFTEDAVDNRLRQYMYNERIRNQKELFDVYKVVKAQCPAIQFTKVNIEAYNKMNLFVDVSYYNKLFIENNKKMGEHGIKLYSETLRRFLNNSTIDREYKVKSIFIPVLDYYSTDVNIMDYNKSLNPVSLITRLVKRNDFDTLKKIFGNNNVFFFGKNSYFKINFSEFKKSELQRFISNINNIFNKIVPNDEDMVKDTPNAIVTDIVDKIENSKKVNLYGALGKVSKEVVSSSSSDEKIEKMPQKKVTVKDKNNVEKSEKEVAKEVTEKKKEELVESIKDAAQNSTSTDEALEKLDNDYIANLIQDISDEESTEIKASATRKARINSLSDDLKKKKVKGESISQMLEDSQDTGEDPLPVSSANINSINNDQWDNLQYVNFNKEYNVDEDIMAILDFFSTRTVPVGIRNVDVEDTTTSEDLKETWTVQCEDIGGTRFQLKFDIPLFKNNRFMRLRGNDKTINAQLMNLPIIKTEFDTAQITTNYNKIFFYTFGNAVGKSNVVSGKIIKALYKYTGKSITSMSGNNAITALKYEIPMDYMDIGKAYSYIKHKNVTFYFDQDDIKEKYQDIIDLSKGLPIGYDAGEKKIIYSDGTILCSNIIAAELCKDEEFATYYDEAKPSVKYAYSQASILNTKMPVIVICAYCEGLIKTLNKAAISYEITDKRPSKIDYTTHDLIKFKDAFLLYRIDYNSSLFMNGLKECNTIDYSIKDVNSKTMWTEMLDNFGGRIKADGLDNFYDLMFDPISQRICNMYDLPQDFCDALIYASNLLSDTKYNKHVDISGNRFRTNEIVAGYTYKVLSKAYADYRTKLKKTGKATMTVKQSAIIDAIMMDNTCSDLSTINELNYANSNSMTSFKGLSGLNSDRSYSLEKRTYDESMTNILGMSTGFAATVGVDRIMTTNANINGKRGYISDKSNEKSKMNDVNTMTTAENLTPMCTTHDDPFRLAMSYVQRSKHDMRVAGGDPLLITNGMDDALTMFTPDVFSFNAKDNGTVVEHDDDHVVIQYNDGSIDFVDLNNKVYKNSDGGFYTSVKLEVDKSLGTKVKKGQLIAYDPMSYSVNCGYDNSATYNQGTLAKVAIITSDKGFEDSCIVSSYISDALSSNVIMEVPVTLSKNTNIFNMIKVGDQVQEGDPLLIIQNTFEDNDVNVLLKNLVDDEDTVTSLGRIPIKSHNTGVIEDINIYRTCELDEMSPSLKKIVSEYERKRNAKAKQIAKYDENLAKQYTCQKLPQEGKLKNIEDGVLIEIYVSYKDDFSVGDKLIFLGAQKGVAKEVVQEGYEPTSSYRPSEPIDAIASMVSFDKRMCCAPLQYTLAGKGLVELDRQVKDIMGIKQDYTIRHKF